MTSISSSRGVGGALVLGLRDPDRIDRVQRHPQAVPVPLLGVVAAGVGVDDRLDHVPHPLQHALAEVLAAQDLLPARVHLLALLVQHVVVLDDVLAVDEVELLDLLLGALDPLGEHAVLDRRAVGRAELVEDRVDAVAGEQADHLVLRRQVEAGLAGVALAAGAAAQLVVDAPRLVALGAEHVQAAEIGHALAELDVDAAAGHVGGDRDRAQLPGLRDDVGLALVVLRVQHLVLDAAPLSSFDRCSDTSTEIVPTSTGWPIWLRSSMSSTTASNFSSAVLKMRSFSSSAGHRDVGRDRHHLEVVDLVELGRLGGGGARHAGQLLVHAEVVLDRDRGDGHVLLLDAHVLLGLDRLVQALRPAAALHDAAGELVDDLDLAVDHHVLVVALVQLLGLDRLDQVVDQLAVLGGVQVLDAQRLLDLVDARLGRATRCGTSRPPRSPRPAPGS